MKRLVILLIVLSLGGCDVKSTKEESPVAQELDEPSATAESPSEHLTDSGAERNQDQYPENDQDLNLDRDQTQEQELRQEELEEKIEASLKLPTGAFFPGNELTSGIIIDNPTEHELELWIELKLISHNGEEVYSVLRSCQVLSNCYLEQDLSFPDPELTQSNSYIVSMTVWNGRPGEGGSEILAEQSTEQGFVFFQTQENYDSIDEDVWEISDKRLGRSSFKTEHVSVTDGILSIRMPAGKLEGGELASKEQYGYGVYEARMKLPEVPSSITGFFLYEAPDYYYEIDIELYNMPDTQLMITTYAEGKVQNHYTTALGFDPTEDFHDYRIEYRKDRLEFYVDNEYVVGWQEGIPDGMMRIMINTWFPKWLEGTVAKEDQVLLVDWLRY